MSSSPSSAPHLLQYMDAPISSRFRVRKNDTGQIEDLATLRFVDWHENVIFVGSPGVGKTHLAVALGVEAVRHRRLTYFVGCQRLSGISSAPQTRGSWSSGCASIPICRC